MTNAHSLEGTQKGAFSQVSELMGWCPSGEFKSPLGHQ